MNLNISSETCAVFLATGRLDVPRWTARFHRLRVRVIIHCVTRWLRDGFRLLTAPTPPIIGSEKRLIWKMSPKKRHVETKKKTASVLILNPSPLFVCFCSLIIGRCCIIGPCLSLVEPKPSSWVRPGWKDAVDLEMETRSQFSRFRELILTLSSLKMFEFGAQIF